LFLGFEPFLPDSTAPTGRDNPAQGGTLGDPMDGIIYCLPSRPNGTTHTSNYIPELFLVMFLRAVFHF
jgi:hypothetical protein